MIEGGSDKGGDGTSDDMSIAAAEYVLGLVSDEESTTLELFARDNELFRQEIAKWQGYVAEFAHELPEAAPPARVLASIKAKTQAAQPRPVPQPVVRTRLRSVWENTGFWRGLSFASMAAALIIAAVAFREPARPQAQKLVVTIARKEGATAFVASYDPTLRQIVLVPSAKLNIEGKVPELWIAARGGNAISLGVIDGAHAQQIIIPEQLAPHARTGSSLIVTLEPPGGAPGGVATGPAIAQGVFSSI
jgi:anti-sigma-K factor RskA